MQEDRYKVETSFDLNTFEFISEGPKGKIEKVVVYTEINLSTLNKFSNTVDIASLYKGGYIQKRDKVKILAKGEIKKALTVKAHAFSEKAKQAIENAGGKIEVIK